MTIRYFTVDEANALLPELEPLVGDLLRRRARASSIARDIAPALSEIHTDLGGPEATALAGEFAAIEDLVARIQAHGCVVKSLESGLLDFLAEQNGRDVFLCWRYGESRIEYYHELHTGFAGRQRLR